MSNFRQSISLNPVVVAKIGAYSVTGIDDILLGSTNIFTFTLPSATTTQKTYTFEKTDVDFTKIITITDGGSFTTTLNTQNESVQVITNGTAWSVLRRSVPSVWTAYTPTFTGFGTVSAVTTYYKRVGDSLQVQANWTNGTCTAVGAQLTLPSGLSVDSTKVVNNTSANPGTLVGYWANSASNNCGEMVTSPATSATVATFAGRPTDTGKLIQQNATAIVSDGTSCACVFTIPISGWNG